MSHPFCFGRKREESERWGIRQLLRKKAEHIGCRGIWHMSAPKREIRQLLREKRNTLAIWHMAATRAYVSGRGDTRQLEIWHTHDCLKYDTPTTAWNMILLLSGVESRGHRDQTDILTRTQTLNSHSKLTSSKCICWHRDQTHILTKTHTLNSHSKLTSSKCTCWCCSLLPCK